MVHRLHVVQTSNLNWKRAGVTRIGFVTVVSDDGLEIRLTLYREDGKGASVEFSPACALASRRLAAASPRLS